MRILLTNDDGLYSPGLRAVAEALVDEHELYISAPDAERSGVSHSFTFLTMLRAFETRLRGLENIPAFAVSGTPADCVKLAIGNLVPMPDLVISGINLGANRGTDVFYSGTVAAAMEAALNGVRAIAISNIAFPPTTFGACIPALRCGMKLMRREGSIMLLNINAPDTDESALKGCVVTKLSRQSYKAQYEKRLDPYGRPYYWTSTEMISRSSPETDDDERWTKQGYAAITPLLTCLCDHEAIDRLNQLMQEESV
ncbi:MAG TPA: 5'/3'-nucleotidase SurE [Clostridia bacterium]|nr:5'/3'-nucleotidase SurE [Clostridia bacterium]